MTGRFAPEIMCANFKAMQGGSHSIRTQSAVHLALIAFAFAAMAFLSGKPPARLAGIEDRVRQIQAPIHAAVPVVSLDTLFSEDLHEQEIELSEPTDDDETEGYFLRLAAFLRLELPTYGSKTGHYQASVDRALTPFHQRALSSRGSPSA